MVEEKDVSSHRIKKTPKSQLTGEPPSPETNKIKTLKLTKTDILYSKTKEKPQT